uniref:C-type lectin domain-containing protein n=1 Tax=Haplochromis burtoni TaxID=8153 RepID=A0A3Q2VMR9_HAPBU
MLCFFCLYFGFSVISFLTLLLFAFMFIVSFSESDVTFVFIKKKMTWTDAQSFCRANYTDLASVRNMSENQKIKELIPKGKKVWIGLFRGWMWTDGSKTSFTYWNVNQPSSVVSYNCASVYFGAAGKWESHTCDFRRGFICYNGSGTLQVYFDCSC